MTESTSRKGQWSFTGKVVSGKGEAVFFTQLDWVKDQCRDKLGFIPYPGTLNLQVASADLWRKIETSNLKRVELVPVDPSFCTGNALTATIQGVHVAIIIPEEKVRVHGKNIVEIIAPIGLRDAFSLKEGALVTVTVNDREALRPTIVVQAAIFDLDGTLIDSTNVYYSIIEAAFESLGLPNVPRSKILEAARYDEFNWALVLPPGAMISKPDLLEKVLQRINALYPDIFHKQVTPIPGTRETLMKIAQTGTPIGVVTSTLKANMADKEAVLKKYDLDRLLDIIITIDDTERKKPAPDPLYLCAQKLNIPAEGCVYVGDMRTDIEAGKNAGMKTVAVLTGFDGFDTLKATAPDAIIASVAQFHQVVDIQ